VYLQCSALFDPPVDPPEARLAVGRGPRALGGATMPVLLYPFTHKTWTTMERFEDAAADRAMLLLWEREAQLLEMEGREEQSEQVTAEASILRNHHGAV
jgi:hypothetical protein